MVPSSSQAVKFSLDRRLSCTRELGNVPVIKASVISTVVRSEKYPISSGIDPMRPFLARIGRENEAFES